MTTTTTTVFGRSTIPAREAIIAAGGSVYPVRGCADGVLGHEVPASAAVVRVWAHTADGPMPVIRMAIEPAWLGEDLNLGDRIRRGLRYAPQP